MTLLHKQDLRLGAFYGVLAALSMTLMSLCVKLIGGRVSIPTILFFRFLVGLAIFFPYFARDMPGIFKIDHPFKFALRVLYGVLSVATFFFALRYISFTNALALSNTAPLFVPIITSILIKAETHISVWMSIVIGFIGVVFILRPDQGIFELPSLIALSSGLFTAIALYYIRVLTEVTSVKRILFYNFVFAIVFSAVFVPFTWMSLTKETMLLLVGSGVFGSLYQKFSMLAYAKTDIRISASFLFLCILFGAIVERFIWHTSFQAFEVMGIGMVILGGLSVLYFGKKYIAK